MLQISNLNESLKIDVIKVSRRYEVCQKLRQEILIIIRYQEKTAGGIKCLPDLLQRLGEQFPRKPSEKNRNQGKAGFFGLTT